MAKAVSFPVAVGGGGSSSSYPAVAVAVGVPVDLGSGSGSEQKDHRPHYEPQTSAVHAAVVQLAIHAVVDDDDERRRQRPPLLPIHHVPGPAAANEDHPRRQERLRYCMIMPQMVLCSITFVFGILMVYLANTPQERAQINWELLVTVSSLLIMLFSFLSVLLSYRGVYYYNG